MSNPRTVSRADELRRLAAKVKDATQARRLLALAAVRDGMNRTEAARIGGMDRQTLRDWAHRFNQYRPDGLIDIKPTGRPSKLSDEQKEALKQLVETGPDPEKDGVVRWRCVDLKRVLGQCFGVDLSEVSLGRALKKLGFSLCLSEIKLAHTDDAVRRGLGGKKHALPS